MSSVNEITPLDYTTTGTKSLWIPGADMRGELSDVILCLKNADASNMLRVKLETCVSTVWKAIIDLHVDPSGQTVFNHSFSKVLALDDGDGTNPRLRLDISGASTDFHVRGSVVGFIQI